MPFAPMHELAKKYQLTDIKGICHFEYFDKFEVNLGDVKRTFELGQLDPDNLEIENLLCCIANRVTNTMCALQSATPDTICINLGGGYHHAGKYPNTGYAYSLINDIIWAVDYQLEQGKTIGIIDLDFHFGGGTWDEYRYNHWDTVNIIDVHHPQGILQKHGDITGRLSRSYFTTETLSTPQVFPMCIPTNVDKIILNIGTDWYQDDVLFGQYGKMLAAELIEVWWDTIRQITVRKIPLAITCGGGYGPGGLNLYAEFISGLQLL
jgi:acetoin utilization deacetylase AcuC-like enzyme